MLILWKHCICICIFKFKHSIAPHNSLTEENKTVFWDLEPKIHSRENGSVLWKLAANGSDALRDDDLRPAHHPRRVRAPRHQLFRRTRPPSIPRRNFLSLSQIQFPFLSSNCVLLFLAHFVSFVLRKRVLSTLVLVFCGICSNRVREEGFAFAAALFEFVCWVSESGAGARICWNSLFYCCLLRGWFGFWMLDASREELILNMIHPALKCNFCVFLGIQNKGT